MSDGEATPYGDIDTDPAAETRAAASNGEVNDAMPLVTANRAAPEGIAPAHRAGTGDGRSRRPDPDGPPPDTLTVNGLKAIEQVVAAAGLDPLPPDRYLAREESWLRFHPRGLEVGGGA